MQVEVHPSSVQNLYLPVRDKPPTGAEVALSSQTVEVALPAVGASPSSWVTASWASGTLRKGDARYYVAVADLDDHTLADGTTYQPWVRVGGATGSIIKVPGTLKVSDS